MSTDTCLTWTVWLGYEPALLLLCCVWTFLTAELTIESKALEDVLREKEGKGFFLLLIGLLCVLTCVYFSVDKCQQCLLLDALVQFRLQ